MNKKFRQSIALALCAALAALCLGACAQEDTGPVKNNVVFDGSNWIYVDDNGMPDETYSGLAENEDGVWLITDGLVDFYTGPYYYDGIYHIIVGGKDYS